MKTLIFILLSITAYPQAIFRMPMNVQEVTFNRLRYCDNEVDVIWGFNHDTVCFLYKEKARCFYPLTKQTLKKVSKNKLLPLTENIEKRDKLKDRHFLLQNHLDEIYVIRIIVPSDGKILIFITDLTFGFPNYVLGFNCSECK